MILSESGVRTSIAERALARALPPLLAPNATALRILSVVLARLCTQQQLGAKARGRAQRGLLFIASCSVLQLLRLFLDRTLFACQRVTLSSNAKLTQRLHERQRRWQGVVRSVNSWHSLNVLEVIDCSHSQADITSQPLTYVPLMIDDPRPNSACLVRRESHSGQFLNRASFSSAIVG